ncbi:hypothetical protein ABKV19_015932 [Rosa sericea]
MSYRSNNQMARIRPSFDIEANYADCKDDNPVLKAVCSYYEVLGCKTRILGPKEHCLQTINYIFLVFCFIALALDPLFCYILIVNDENKCLRLDKTVSTVATASRSAIDFFYMFHTICQYFCAALRDIEGTIVTPHSYPKIIRKHKSFRKDHKLAPKSKWESFLSYLFFPLVDIFVILPLPQVLAFAVIPKLNESRVFDATQTLKSVFLFQYGLRVIRICFLLKNVTRASVNILSETTWANLSFFLLASHVLGAFWYLFSIERKTTCWVKVCKNQGVTCSLYCDDTMVLNPLQLINDYSCSTKTNNTAFDYGIYLHALESGVVYSDNFLQKISLCLWWGLQNISSFGQSLETSTYVWEIYFSIVVSISGLVLFALFIGNIQTYLNSKAERVKEMKSNGQEIELWMDFHSLPKCLKTRFRRYQKYRWQETRGVDVGKFLQKLPRDLGRDTKLYLCLDALKKVLEFHCKDKRVLRAICDHLKPVFYVKDSIIFREDDQLDEMFIITHGRVRTSTKINGLDTTSTLEKGHFYGEQLFEYWISNSPIKSSSSPALPLSEKTVVAQTDVQVFVIRANELRIVVEKFLWLFIQEERVYSPARFNSEKWKPWAAKTVQAAFHRHIAKKKALAVDLNPDRQERRL